MSGECGKCGEHCLDCVCHKRIIIDENQSCKLPETIGYIESLDDGYFKIPEYCNIYLDLEKYFCQSSQKSKWNFTCEGEDTIVILGKDLFKILQKLVKDYESGDN